MRRAPADRFLGVAPGAGSRVLLGLGEGVLDRVMIETALRERIAAVYAHPDGRSPEADEVRQRLRRAAAILTEQVMSQGRTVGRSAHGPGRRGRAAPPLTEFDRFVLATLVGCGGWNAESRARLVALAASYGVTPAGLMTIIGGLSRYARSGGGRLGVEEITSGAARLAAPAAAATAESLPIPFAAGSGEAAGARPILPVLPDDGLWSTIKLCLLFGVLTILTGLLVLQLVLPVRSPPPFVASPPLLEVVPAPVPPRAEPAATRGAEEPLARFRPLPSFLGQALPAEAIAAADACAQLPAELDLITRKLAVSDTPAEAVFKSWEVALNTIGTGWVLTDASTREAVEAGIVDVLYEAADAPTTADRLLDALTPSRGHPDAPAELWRGAWMTGTLGVIDASRTLPPSVQERARRQLRIALDTRDLPEPPGFTSAAGAWLDDAAARLADRIESEPRVYDFWEVWLAAERELGAGERMNAAFMSAIEQILATQVDLSRSGPAVDVLGRLLTTADFRSSPVVRTRVLALFEDDERYTDHDLWVLTSLLAQMDAAPWFDRTLVLPPDGGPRFRNRIRDRIAARWPEPSGPDHGVPGGRGVPVDARVGGRWLSVCERAAAQPLGADYEQLMRQLLAACRLNVVAGLLAAGRDAEAAAMLDEVEGTLEEAAGDGRRGVGAGVGGVGGVGSAGPRVGGPRVGGPRMKGARAGGAPRRAGQPLGRDGEWAAAYTDARRNAEEKLGLLRALRTQAGTDLGPLDAAVFVREVYRGSPAEVRSLAGAVLVEQFADGPIVALEMLDQFPDAAETERLAETLRRLTGMLLPPSGGDEWSRAARLALVEHALSFRPAREAVIDDLAQELSEAYAGRAELLRREPGSSGGLEGPADAVQFLADAWQERARSVIASRPVPDDLAGLARRRATRRRLAEGSIQLLVAEQLTILDHLAYVTVAEQPGLAGDVSGVLSASARRRLGSDHVLHQAIEAERAAAQLWALRMTLVAGPGIPGGDREGGS